MAEATPQRRLDRLEAEVAALRGQVAAQGIVVDLLMKAVASLDAASSGAVAMALEVAEMDHLEIDGDIETAQALRRLRERLGLADR